MLKNTGGHCKKKPAPLLGDGVGVELDECYVVAGQKGQPRKVRARGRKPRRRRLKGKRGRGTSADEKNPVFGMVDRGGALSLHVLPDVKRKTIEPIIKATIKAGAEAHTDEYNIYAHMSDWGYVHKTVNHGAGEFARDEDGDGFHEVHCNTMEGAWSLMRSWLRPHRGVSQEKLPFYVGFFEWVHNLRKRGKAAVHESFCLLFKQDLRSYQDCILPT